MLDEDDNRSGASVATASSSPKQRRKHRAAPVPMLPSSEDEQKHDFDEDDDGFARPGGPPRKRVKSTERLVLVGVLLFMLNIAFSHVSACYAESKLIKTELITRRHIPRVVRATIAPTPLPSKLMLLIFVLMCIVLHIGRLFPAAGLVSFTSKVRKTF